MSDLTGGRGFHRRNCGAGERVRGLSPVVANRELLLAELVPACRCWRVCGLFGVPLPCRLERASKRALSDDVRRVRAGRPRQLLART
jgi:hypothetical protein